MIRYDLQCEAGHGFESWFRSSGDYDAQRKRLLVECPVCGSPEIEKRIMAPQVARKDRAERAKPRDEKAPVAMMSPQEAEFRQKLRDLREHVTKNAEHVGDKFPEIARQMHNEEIERRSIYGEASADEVKALLEDEVDIHPLPNLPEDHN